jgi:shikimate kinase
VVALGGGAWIRGENRALIADRGCYTVWLDAPFDLCWQRISSSDPSERPLAQDRASAKRLFDERRPVYAQAMLRVAITDHTSAEEVANEILARRAIIEKVRLTETMTLPEFRVVVENA